MTEQRRLAAILVADMAGYSRLMGRDKSGTLAALKSLRQEVVDPAIASHGGRIVKTIGDGLLLEFPSVVNAVRCAIQVQTAMADRTAGIAEDRRITFRIGINLGDIIVEGDDIFGDGVTSPPDFRRLPHREGFAYRAACTRMCATGSTSRSTTAASRRSRTLHDRSRYGAGPARQ